LALFNQESTLEIVTLILTSIGGAATVLLIAAFLGKSLISHWFGKELERYKAEIARENSEALEHLKSEQLLHISARERSIELQILMDRYRGPLLHSANDLQSRIYNLVVNYVIDIYFIDDLGNSSEKEYFIKNTTFLIAQYFAWAEIIRNEVQFIEFYDTNHTKNLSSLQSSLCTAWQGDSRSDLSVWAGEQRGIGELMIEKKGDQYQCIGYSTFLTLLHSCDDKLLINLENRVKKYLESNEKHSSRLVSVQNSLIDIIEFLDPDNKRFNKDHLKKIS
jgi:hypothetical protein